MSNCSLLYTYNTSHHDCAAGTWLHGFADVDFADVDPYTMIMNDARTQIYHVSNIALGSIATSLSAHPKTRKATGREIY